MSNTKFIKHQMQVTTNKVTNTLGISSEAYIKYLYDAATNWLLDHLNNDTLVVDEVMQTAEFWKWWALQAYHRDVQWLSSSAYAIAASHEPARLLNDWLYYHSAARLLDMNNKHAQILYNSYANINWVKNAPYN